MKLNKKSILLITCIIAVQPTLYSFSRIGNYVNIAAQFCKRNWKPIAGITATATIATGVWYVWSKNRAPNLQNRTWQPGDIERGWRIIQGRIDTFNPKINNVKFKSDKHKSDAYQSINQYFLSHQLDYQKEVLLYKNKDLYTWSEQHCPVPELKEIVRGWYEKYSLLEEHETRTFSVIAQDFFKTLVEHTQTIKNKMDLPGIINDRYKKDSEKKSLLLYKNKTLLRDYGQNQLKDYQKDIYDLYKQHGFLDDLKV